MQVSKRLLLSHLLQHTHLHTYPQNGTFPFKHNLKSQLIKTCQNDSQHSEHPQYLPNLTQVLVEGVIARSHKGNNSLMVEGQPRESGEIRNYPEMLAERQAAAQAGQSSCSTTLHSGGALPGRASHRASPWQHQQLSKPETRHFQTGYTSFVCQALKITLHQCFQSTCEILWDTKPALPNSWANWLMLLHPPNHQHHL